MASAGRALADDGLDDPPPSFALNDPRIVESSSLVVARGQRGLVYTANDGPATRIYVVDMASGDTVATTTLAGVRPVDLEAMALSPDGGLYIADIGDNDSQRATVSVYRIDEPGREDATVQPQTYEFTYPDGPRDAEALLVEPGSGRLFIVSKEVPTSTVYAAPPTLTADSVNRLRAVASAPPLVTDGAFLPGGDTVVLRTYTAAASYRVPGWSLLRAWRLPTQRQGESLAALPSGTHVLVGSEGPGSVVQPVRVPPAHHRGPPDRPPAAEPPPVARGSDMKSSVAVVAGLTVGLLSATVAVVAWARRRQADRTTVEPDASRQTSRSTT